MLEIKCVNSFEFLRKIAVFNLFLLWWTLMMVLF